MTPSLRAAALLESVERSLTSGTPEATSGCCSQLEELISLVSAEPALLASVREPLTRIHRLLGNIRQLFRDHGMEAEGDGNTSYNAQGNPGAQGGQTLERGIA